VCTVFVSLLPPMNECACEDKCVYGQIYGSEGVMEAWEKAKDEGIVHQIGMPHTWKDRGWVVGRYIR